MKWILKILTAPVILLIDLFTLVCVGIISCSAIPLRIVSGIIALLGTAVLVTYSPKNGMPTSSAHTSTKPIFTIM